MASNIKARFLRDAERYVLQGRINQAISEYLKIVKNEPDDVLTLNTLGDLYLRQGKEEEARKHFTKVAEIYSNNNFLLKAIAVYKKILNQDPKNLELNLTLATLYARQGQNVSARGQFLHVAELFVREGKVQESLDAYEKVVELDPANTAIQLKLADIYLDGGKKEKAQIYFSGAAKALAKAGDFPGAISAYKRALALNAVDVGVLQGFFQVCLKSGNITEAIEQLEGSTRLMPDDLSLREMLGQVYLAASNIEKAVHEFKVVLSADASRHQNFFAVSRAYLNSGNLDLAATCLDEIIPILISRRETDRAIEAYNFILSTRPDHVPTLKRLADLYSATNAQAQYLEKTEQAAQSCLEQRRPLEALEFLKAALQIDSENTRLLRLHRQAFEASFPDATYERPEQPSGMNVESAPAPSLAVTPDSEKDDDDENSTVEADLLMNYGMNEKALALLLGLEAHDPWDKKVRTRLLTIYKEEQAFEKAAEQCLLLAVLLRQEKNEEAAQRYLAEAGKLAPATVDQLDLYQFAQQRGIALVAPGSDPTPAGGLQGKREMDLSGDLSEIFFREGAGVPDTEGIEVLDDASDAIAEEFTHESPRKPTSDTIEAQLQEADFYIRLGFNDEARAKLDEIARKHPDNPELLARYKMLPGVEQGAQEEPAPELAVVEPETEPATWEPSGSAGLFQEMNFEVDVDPLPAENGFALSTSDVQVSAPSSSDHELTPVAEPTGVQLPPPTETEMGDSVNMIFADLLDEVNAVTEGKNSAEDFETHFSLGLAYREMDLVGDAIREFQHAISTLSPASSPKQVIQCCGMLSTCFLEKGMPSSAIRWCQTGLRVSEIAPHEELALRYELGVAHSITGDARQALESFGHVFKIDPGYRDVAQRIDDLKGGPNRDGS